ncbi:PLP-dependent cysteine synthase family protein [Mycolicibacterium wolinskyi]|uniref:Pyridoxal-5'-phosphate-dependent protein subunit beta n=1 Tax=Mycolicibacterium wolinskyi TaxID=59750 RepID=A0A1X2FBY6_9MYCO|nr:MULTISPECIES: PLP-dependent cysteine synthase family protein [Mycolicibacterium]MCV7283785.1 PLP-dependent cysteine synthase family protein [Mycolicibacterium wolinskyi]MCV7297219.1 PLP-dependent cysteine synthase family protein [Mycolicibacterium goodii]ORX15904.1 pyridoxal-5'-phosphate-dependent protein subunit beta [Mycolicibacterium wolinskyi]
MSEVLAVSSGKHASVGSGRLTRNHRPETMVGNTPVLRISEPFTTDGRGFWAKLEGFNPGGMKDRPAMHMVERGRARGDLIPGARIVESTSGTLGLGLALAGTVYGHPVTLVADPGMEPIMHRMLAAYGADVDVVTEPHPQGGWQQARRERVAELLATHPNSWYPDQYNNPDNVAAYRGLALELHAQLGDIDVLVCSVGTGGHSAGVARVLREFNPDLRLIGVDTIGSTIFGQPSATRLMRGLGSSIYPRNVDYRAFDEVHWVAPDEAVWACRTLAATHYASGGWSVGAVALVAGWIAGNEPIETTVAAVFPDGPQRYFDTVYNDDYCRQHGLLRDHRPIEPDLVDDPDEHVIGRWTRTRRIVDPMEGRR